MEDKIKIETSIRFLKNKKFLYFKCIFYFNYNNYEYTIIATASQVRTAQSHKYKPHDY